MIHNKNINPSLFITITITALTLYLIIFTLARIAESTDKAPLKINSDFTVVSVNTHFKNQMSTLDFQNDFKELLGNHTDLILIKKSPDYKKLALHDPSGHFQNIIDEGSYFTPEDFLSVDSKNILIYQKSALNAVSHEGIIPLWGKEKILLGRFSTSALFSNANHAYESIMPILSDYDFTGHYYYINENDDFYVQLSSLMTNHGMTISPERKVAYDERVKLSHLFQRKESYLMIPSFLVVSFSNLISFSLMGFYKKNRMYVHFIYGARPISYLIHRIKSMLALILWSTALGSGIGFLFTYAVYQEFYWLTFLTTFLATMIWLMALYLLSFFMTKNRIRLEVLQ